MNKPVVARVARSVCPHDCPSTCALDVEIVDAHTIGRDGFSWGGKGTIAYKREWPRWTPPAEMIVRQPELEIYRNGMEPGLENPLGARALYIFQNGQDTLYRLHGTLDVETIGKAVSSGCVRLLAQDVIDLYERVPNGSPIVVRQ